MAAKGAASPDSASLGSGGWRGWVVDLLSHEQRVHMAAQGSLP